MVVSENLTAMATELTAQEISDAVFLRTLGLFLSLCVTAFGIFLLKKQKIEIVRYIGLAVSILGILGDITFLLAIVQIMTVMIGT